MIIKLVSFAFLLPLAATFRAPENLPNLPKDLQFLPQIHDQQKAKLVPGPQPLLDGTQSKPHHAAVRKRWGVDNTNECDYWYNPTIHTLGNIGFFGALHAAIAPLSTKLIDMVAYEGKDVRQLVAHELSKKVKSSEARVVDLCCGVGISTRALRNAFPEAETVVGIDTSSEMIEMAAFLSNHLSIVRPLFKRSTKQAKGMVCPTATSFSKANAENTDLPSRSFDLVTIMYAFHEAPKQGREQILKEAHRLLQPGGTLAVVDICSDYKASESMLAGEPYVLEYQRNIHKQLRTFRGFAKVTYKTIIPNRVGMWVMKRATI